MSLNMCFDWLEKLVIFVNMKIDVVPKASRAAASGDFL